MPACQLPKLSQTQFWQLFDRAAVGAVGRSAGQRRVAAGDAGTVVLVVAVVERALGVQISERDVLLTDEQRFAQAVGDPFEADLRLPVAIGIVWNDEHPGGDQDAVGGGPPIGGKWAAGVIAPGVAGVIAGRTEGVVVS